MPSEPVPPTSFLLCRSRQRLCALPLALVRETLRAQPLNALPEMPPFLLGLALIRGQMVPVLDLARLLGGADAAPGARLVMLDVAGRGVALALDAVLGVRALDAAALGPVPPLLQEADTGLLAAVGTLDAELLLVLRAALALPEAVWDAAQECGA